MKNRIVLMLSVLFILVSCDKEDKIEELEFVSKDVAQAAIAQADDTMHADLTEMVQSDGAAALVDLVDLIDMSGTVDLGLREIEATATRRQKLEANIKKMGKIFTPNLSKNISKKTNESSRETTEVEEEFVFADHLGIYEWKSDINDFVKTSSDVDYMSMIFPTKGSTTNNANFKLTQYETVIFLDETLPKKIVAELYIESVLKASLDFDVTYGLPDYISSANVNLFVAPFEYSLVLTNATNTSSSIDFGIHRDDAKMFGVELDVEFTDRYKAEGKVVDLTVSYRTMSITGKMLVEELYKAEENEEIININDYITGAVYQEGAKLGDLRFDVVTYTDIFGNIDEKIEIYIVYQDGSDELLEEEFKSAIDEMESFVRELNGDVSE